MTLKELCQRASEWGISNPQALPRDRLIRNLKNQVSPNLLADKYFFGPIDWNPKQLVP